MFIRNVHCCSALSHNQWKQLPSPSYDPLPSRDQKNLFLSNADFIRGCLWQTRLAKARTFICGIILGVDFAYVIPIAMYSYYRDGRHARNVDCDVGRPLHTVHTNWWAWPRQVVAFANNIDNGYIGQLHYYCNIS